MSSILRGLLQSPASATLVDDERTGSVGTPRLHRQHCIDQWDCIRKEDYQTECTNNRNSISNIKMEENIDQDQFWRHCSEEETSTKDKNKESNEGFYYTYITEGSHGNQEWIDELVSPTQLQSPPSGTKSQYYHGKTQSKQSVEMNTYKSMETLSPTAFTPNEVPDFGQDEFLASCFGSGFGYDGSSLDDSLLTPPGTLALSKLMDASGGLSLSDCGGVFDSGYNELHLDADWLNEPISLHTPDSQDGDITFTSSTPYTSLTDTPTPYTDVTLPITPGSSHPPTPLSTSPSSDVDDVLSLFSDQNSNDSSSYRPSEYLPFGASLGSFDSSPDTSHYNSPALSPVNSPYSQDVSYYTPCELPPSPLETPQLSGNNLAKNTSKDRKRKAPESIESATPKTKRRLSLTAKKERKREQNKTAALRYRQKKKEEKTGCFSKVDDLEAKNAELKKTLNSMTAEIQYLKKLWSEVSAVKNTKQGQQLLSMC